MMHFVSDEEEIIVDKGENAVGVKKGENTINQHFLPFFPRGVLPKPRSSCVRKNSQLFGKPDQRNTRDLSIKSYIREISSLHCDAKMLSRWLANPKHDVTQTFYPTFDPLPDDIILDWSKLKQIADGIFKVNQKRKISAI